MPTERAYELTPAFLLAAAINPEGTIRFPVGADGYVEVSLDEMGGLVQRRYTADSPAGASPSTGECGPLDMVLFAEWLAATFGEQVPPLFRLRDDEEGGRCFETSEARGDRARIRTLQDAFNVYLLAYEERLI